MLTPPFRATFSVPLIIKTLVLMFLITVPAFAGQDPRIAEGIALHDAGRYDEAIAKYKAVLADDPANGLASYEMAFSYETKQDFAKCIAVLRPLAGAAGPLQQKMLASLGNCLDGAGDGQGAVAAYRKALSLAPDDPPTLFNLGVALFRQSKLDEAREVLKRDLIARPAHAGGHNALARVFELQGFRAAAVLEYLRFLALEPSSPRSKDAATHVLALLNHGVEDKGAGKDGKKNISLMIDPSSRTEEGDFHTWEMGMALASGTRFVSEDKNLTEFDIARNQLASTLAMLLEMKGAEDSFSGRQNVPFFATLDQRKLLDTLDGLVLISLGLKGSENWMKENAKGVQELTAFVNGQR